MRLRSPSLPFRILPALLLAGSAALAQAQATTGALTLTITDRATGHPMKDATVVLTSPAMFKERIYRADAQGQIRALLLPVGNYSAVVSRDGFLAARLADVRIGLGTNMAQNIDLAPLSSVQGAMMVTTIGASFEVDGGLDSEMDSEMDFGMEAGLDEGLDSDDPIRAEADL